MANEGLMDRVAKKGGNNLSVCSEIRARRPQFIGTYDSLGSATILLAVVLEIVEDLGARHYADEG